MHCWGFTHADWLLILLFMLLLQESWWTELGSISMSSSPAVRLLPHQLYSSWCPSTAWTERGSRCHRRSPHQSLPVLTMWSPSASTAVCPPRGTKTRPQTLRLGMSAACEQHHCPNTYPKLTDVYFLWFCDCIPCAADLTVQVYDNWYDIPIC